MLGQCREKRHISLFVRFAFLLPSWDLRLQAPTAGVYSHLLTSWHDA